jgi:hypothetical protein
MGAFVAVLHVINRCEIDPSEADSYRVGVFTALAHTPNAKFVALSLACKLAHDLRPPAVIRRRDP